jgi:hypothetical protein
MGIGEMDVFYKAGTEVHLASGAWVTPNTFDDDLCSMKLSSPE